MDVQVTYFVKKGVRGQFLSELYQSGVVDSIRAEKGCLRYEYYKSYENADMVLLLEKWETPEMQKEHMHQPHMKKLADIKGKYVQDTKIKLYD